MAYPWEDAVSWNALTLDERARAFSVVVRDDPETAALWAALPVSDKEQVIHRLVIMGMSGAEAAQLSAVLVATQPKATIN